MTKIDIYSGFLGAGKTTLIRKMISEAYGKEKLVLIENEFGDISVDGGFLQEAGIEIREMYSGCICCSLVGDFGEALEQVIRDYAPDRIIIEPSGVGKLSDVVAAVKQVVTEGVELGFAVAVADASKCKIYSKNFGEFYNNQLENASTIVLSRTDSIPQDKLDKAIALIREHNQTATLVTTPWDQLSGKQLLEAMEHEDTLSQELHHMEEAHRQLHHEHHHHEHEEECCCGGHGHHEHHHHEHHEGCGCGHDHHHHHADEVFASWGVETARKFTPEGLREALDELEAGEAGVILRAKGIVAAEDGSWIHFDYVPGEISIRQGGALVMGRLCVIGAELKEEQIARIFGV